MVKVCHSGMIDIELLGMIDIHTICRPFFPNDSRSGDESFVAVACAGKDTLVGVMVYHGKTSGKNPEVTPPKDGDFTVDDFCFLRTFLMFMTFLW